jgi:fructose-bisphosphate aldolase class I
MLQDQGVIIGVKIDGGLAKFNGSDVEEITQGADAGLPDRLAQYYALGARFTKFRSFLHIDTERGFPSAACVEANAQVQARFARASQEAGLVPIVEPEIDMVGTHPLVVCQSVTERVLKLVFELLRKEGVSLGGLVLKPNMVLSGNKAENQASPEEVAAATLAVLKATVPVSVPGIAFLSGGQSDEEAYRNLNAIAQGPGGVRVPYELTYSFGRAAQDTARQVWQGKAENIEAARQAFETQLQRMSQARMGQLSH